MFSGGGAVCRFKAFIFSVWVFGCKWVCYRVVVDRIFAGQGVF